MAILGYNTIGGSSISNADTIHISSLVPVISSKISHGTDDTRAFKYASILGAIENKMAFYKVFDDGYIPYGRIYAATVRQSVVINPATWSNHLYITVYGVDVTFVIGDEYWLASWTDSGGYGTNIFYDTGSSGDGGSVAEPYVNGNGFTGWTSPLYVTSNSRLYSIYSSITDLSVAHKLQLKGGSIKMKGGTVQFK